MKLPYWVKFESALACSSHAYVLLRSSRCKNWFKIKSIKLQSLSKRRKGRIIYSSPTALEGRERRKEIFPTFRSISIFLPRKALLDSQPCKLALRSHNLGSKAISTIFIGPESYSQHSAIRYSNIISNPFHSRVWKTEILPRLHSFPPFHIHSLPPPTPLPSSLFYPSSFQGSFQITLLSS